ncbi:hypothetical protein GGX14DRAFT_661802 [Mycena pura]|uniref:Uncharacterized protein n=1 Tax=Mycena pura TaxID=153505 RepID=A0AAD6V489_9AGAR|nr:hypothetical protein GGX14DRAFT_661802 [Mycena pura]
MKKRNAGRTRTFRPRQPPLFTSLVSLMAVQDLHSILAARRALPLPPNNSLLPDQEDLPVLRKRLICAVCVPAISGVVSSAARKDYHDANWYCCTETGVADWRTAPSQVSQFAGFQLPIESPSAPPQSLTSPPPAGTSEISLLRAPPVSGSLCVPIYASPVFVNCTPFDTSIEHPRVCTCSPKIRPMSSVFAAARQPFGNGARILPITAVAPLSLTPYGCMHASPRSAFAVALHVGAYCDDLGRAHPEPALTGFVVAQGPIGWWHLHGKQARQRVAHRYMCTSRAAVRRNGAACVASGFTTSLPTYASMLHESLVEQVFFEFRTIHYLIYPDQVDQQQYVKDQLAEELEARCQSTRL